MNDEDAVTAVQALFRTVFPTLPSLSLPKIVYASTLASRSTTGPLFSTSLIFDLEILYKISVSSAPGGLETRLQIYLGSSLKRRINITILHRATHFLNMLRSAFSSLLSDAFFKALPLSDLTENKRVGAIR